MATKERGISRTYPSPGNGKTKLTDALQAEIDEKRNEIHSDQYSMSIGELSSLYRDGELDIHPEFQRYYRWSDEQKSRLIESILLGIPLPSLFVSQRSDGKWDMVDGLQRTSTIFELMGILKDENGSPLPALTCTETKYLKQLKGKQWAGQTRENSLTGAQQLLIKRAKIDVKILLRESDDSAKFELFQRLNTGGSALSNQEVRNAMLIASNRDLYEWLEEMAKYPSFSDCVSLSERAYEERFDMELVLRFLLLKSLPSGSDGSGIGDIGDYLTDNMPVAKSEFARIRKRETETFQTTFDLISAQLGGDAFRRFDSSRQRFTGGFLISAFEVIAFGIGNALDTGIGFDANEIKPRVISLWSGSDFIGSSRAGRRASERLPMTLKKGRELFAK